MLLDDLGVTVASSTVLKVVLLMRISHGCFKEHDSLNSFENSLCLWGSVVSLQCIWMWLSFCLSCVGFAGLSESKRLDFFLFHQP